MVLSTWKFALIVAALMLAPAFICAAGLGVPFAPESSAYRTFFMGNYVLMTVPHYLLLVAYLFFRLKRSTFLVQLLIATLLLGLLRVLILKFVPGREAPIAWVAHYPLWVICTSVAALVIYWLSSRAAKRSIRA